MPLQLERDDINRRLKLTITDPIAVPELIASAERQLAGGAWAYDLLIDARSVRVVPQPSELRPYVSRVGELVAANGPRGPIAFVARESAVVGTAQIYRFLGGEADLFEVFWDTREAKVWLDAQAARRRGETPQSPER